MYKGLLFLLLLVVVVSGANAQVKDVLSPADSSILDTAETPQIDTLKAKYVNQGKVAGRRAALSSAMVPGLGQIRNGITVYRLAKVAGIYTGATLLTLSYMDNNKNYHTFLYELQYRSEHDGKAPPGSRYASYPPEGLIAAKDTFRRNREVVIFSLIGLYLLNIVEAYVDARLKYFDVGDVAFKISPGIINSGTMYGNNSLTPGLNFTLSL